MGSSQRIGYITVRCSSRGMGIAVLAGNSLDNNGPHVLEPIMKSKSLQSFKLESFGGEIPQQQQVETESVGNISADVERSHMGYWHSQ